jgi:integrase
MDGLKREHLKTVIAGWIEAGKSRSTVRNYLAALKSAYFSGLEDGLVTVNPLQRISKLCKGAQSPDKHMQPLTAQEVDTLLNTTQQSKPGLYPVLLCAVRTGLRRGELIGLQWGDG